MLLIIDMEDRSSETSDGALRLARGLTTVTVAVIGAVLVSLPLRVALSDMVVGLEWPLPSIDSTQGAGLEGASAQVSSTTDAAVKWTSAMFSVASMVITGLGVWWLRRLLALAIEGRPFSSEAVRVWNRIALLPVALFTMDLANDFWAGWARERLGSRSGPMVSPNLGMIGWLVAVYAVSAIWQRGMELQDLEESTV